MKQVFYKEKIISYIISIPVGVLIFLLLIAIVSFVLTPEANQLVLLPLLISLVLLFILGYHLYKLEICVNGTQLQLSLGKGSIKRIYLVDQIDMNSLQVTKIPWYYGVGWKLDYSGNTFFCAQSGLALSFRLKGQPGKIIVSTKQHQLLKDAIIQAKIAA